MAMSRTDGPMPADLDRDALEPALAGRPLRTFPALLSTSAEAMAWARRGAPHGAVVVAGYQAAPRGRAGRPFDVDRAHGMGCSVVVRPDLPADREGWPYVAGGVALAATLDRVRLQWPDEARTGAEPLAAVGVQVEVGPERLVWAVIDVLVRRAAPPRAAVIGRLVSALDAALAAATQEVLSAYRQACATLGERITARMMPVGPAGLAITGTAVDVKGDGALVVETDRGNRVAVLPQHLGYLEPADGA